MLIRLMLVDDDVPLTRTLKLSLEDTGRYEVFVVNHSPYAVDAIRQFAPDVVLLDLMMPGMDGGDVAAALRDDPKLSAVPVIVVTALVRKAEEQDLQTEASPRVYLGKPASVQDIDKAVQKVLSKQLSPKQS
jgi:CheY-like chemotaxis protein